MISSGNEKLPKYFMRGGASGIRYTALMSDDFDEKLRKRLAAENPDTTKIAEFHAAYGREVEK
jgi:hypothetical protein